MSQDFESIVEDTYAEGFRSIFGEFLITARDRKWLDHCCNAVTGHASSTIIAEPDLVNGADADCHDADLSRSGGERGGEGIGMADGAM